MRMTSKCILASISDFHNVYNEMSKIYYDDNSEI